MKKSVLHIFSILLALTIILTGFSGCATPESEETGNVAETSADETQACETGEAETDATEEAETDATEETTGNETYEG